MNLVVKMLITLTIIGGVSGAGLSQLDNWAQPKIAYHRQKATEEAIFLVQPNGKSYEKAEAEFELYIVKDESGSEIGYAFPYEGNGYQGAIRVMIGVKSDMKTTTAINILDQVETPGLGTKIMEEPFTSKFKELVVDPRITTIKNAEAKNPGEVQTITGATISSKAVCEIVSNGLEELRKWKGGGA